MSNEKAPLSVSSFGMAGSISLAREMLATPTAYYELSREARRFFEQKDYAKTADAFAELTAAYPNNGETWHLLGTRPNERYWFEQLPKDKAVYVRIIMMRNKPDETIAAFRLRLRELLDKQPNIKNLIVDLRGNTGGNSVFYTELLRTIIAFDAKKEIAS